MDLLMHDDQSDQHLPMSRQYLVFSSISSSCFKSPKQQQVQVLSLKL